MSTLYEIKAELDRFLELLESQRGEITPEQEELWETQQLAFNEKVLGLICYIKNNESDAEQYDAEIKRLKEKKDAAAKRAEWGNKYLAANLTPGEKQKYGVHSISWRKSSAVVIDDESQVPDAFCKFERKVSKAEIKEALEQGGVVPGARIEERMNLTVK